MDFLFNLLCKYFHVIIRGMQTIGVISDTHIPDRGKSLPQKALDIFKAEKVSKIIHAGDISLPRVLKQLGEIAPIEAVRGNRDFMFGNKLPLNKIILIENIRIGIGHGHGTWAEYWKDKVRYLIHGPSTFKNVEDRMLKNFPNVNVIVFGHSHAPLNRIEENGQILFNPGSPKFPNEFISNLLPSVGLLHIDKDQVEAEIVYL